MNEKRPANHDIMIPEPQSFELPDDPLNILRESLEGSDASAQTADSSQHGQDLGLKETGSPSRTVGSHWRMWAMAMAIVLVVGLGLAATVSRHRLAETRLGQWLGLEGEHQHELVPVRDGEGNIKYWTCTMHPSVKSKDPGTCPI